MNRTLVPAPATNIALIDLLDRLLEGGIVIQGNVTLAAAEIDLVKLDLRILIGAIDKVTGR
ncbi:MAG: gas vesicle protein [Actinomycetota bacterium]|nr:gas vesicle protein [Actinomycetota bacterium]